MSSIADFIRFLVDFPLLMHKKFYRPLVGVVIFTILAVFTLASSLLRVNSLELYLLTFIFAIIAYGEFRKYLRKNGFEEPVLVPPINDFAKPTDIVNSLREDDKNSLLFGRSKFPTDVMDGEQKGKEILRGHENSSNLGEQYGNFTGMTLYGGPDMYHQDTLNTVFPKDKRKFKTNMNMDLVLSNNEFENMRAQLLEEQNRRDGTPSNKDLKMTNEVRETLKPFKTQIFKDILERKNKESGIPEEELLEFEDFMNA